MHLCHWPSCRKSVPPRLWGCRTHWYTLPLEIRKEIWDTYVPGQEDRKDPSPEYLAVAEKAQEWAREYEYECKRIVDQIANLPGMSDPTVQP